MATTTPSTGAPYSELEWEAIKAALKGEREHRRRLKQVNPDGVVLFNQAEQSALVQQVVLALRS